MQCKKFLSVSELGLIESCRLSVLDRKKYSVATSVMVKEADAVVEEAVEQGVIDCTAQVGERRQIWWSKPATLTMTDEWTNFRRLAGASDKWL